MLCNKSDCTGCFACYNVCPKNAIEMKEDMYGFIYPIVDTNKCINCKKCEKVCPSINKIKLKSPVNCFAAQAKDDKLLMKSSSGGVATVLANYIISNKGVVYGAAFKDECSVEHIRADNLSDLNKLKGSKYVHSYIRNIYQNVLCDLNENKLVLFIGTPCQVAGLKNYLNKEYTNLFVVDIICHGVPSQKYLKEEVNRIAQTTSVDEVRFRDKRYDCFSFAILKNGEPIKVNNMVDSPYYYSFMNGLTYRENCYSCLYSKSARCSDLTIGDFWGLSEKSQMYCNSQKGVSVILTISKKGRLLLKNISNQLVIEERPIDEAIKGNSQLNHPTIHPKNYEKFKKNYLRHGFYYAYKRVYKKVYIKNKLKKIYIIRMLLKIRNEVKNVKCKK